MQSLEQQCDYLFNCAGVQSISCWDLKEYHIIIIIIKNQKGKISIEFPQYLISRLFAIINKIFTDKADFLSLQKPLAAS